MDDAQEATGPGFHKGREVVTIVLLSLRSERLMFDIP
jgi:hypothetical protein